MSAMMISFSHSFPNARLHCSHGNHNLVLHCLMMQSSSDLGVCAAPQSIINIGGAPSRTMSLVDMKEALGPLWLLSPVQKASLSISCIEVRIECKW